MPFDDSKIPIWLRRTPEQQAADQAYQEQLRSAQGPGRRPNPLERQLIQAAAIKRAAAAELEQLRIDPEPDSHHLAHAEARMAEALAMEGNFPAAAELHPDPEHTARFEAIAAAIERDDNERCNCPIQTATDPVTGQPITIYPDVIEEMVLSPKHGNKLVPVVRCTACGDLNVKETAPQHLIERLDAVRQQHNAARRTK